MRARGKKKSPRALMSSAQQQWHQGQTVRYFSKTYQKYLPAKISAVGVRPDGSLRVDLDIKTDCVVDNLFADDTQSVGAGSPTQGVGTPKHSSPEHAVFK